MKQLIVLIFIVLVVVISSIFTVEEREVAVVTDMYKAQQEYTTGIHFTLPWVNKVDYIYVNERISLLNLPLLITTKTAEKVQVGILVNWQVVNPLLYLQVVSKYDRVVFENLLATELNSRVQEAANNMTLADFNQLSLLSQGSSIALPDLGIIVNKIFIENVLLVDIVQDKAVASVPAIQAESSISVGNENLVIESAYYQAQQIKTATEIEQAKLYAQIKDKDAKFYDYFRKIEIYKATAKSKAELPPLNKIYTRAD